METVSAAMVGTAGTTAVAVPMATTAAGTAVATGATLTMTAAPTVGLFGAGGSLTAAGVISGTATTLSTLANIAGMGLAAKSAEYEGLMRSLQARTEEVKGRDNAARMRLALAKSLASSQAEGAASSIDISTGSPAKMATVEAKEGLQEIANVGFNTKTKATSYRLKSVMSLDTARMTRSLGYLKGAASLVDFAADRAEAGAF